ncbi:MAG TPA: LLM class flavin-dependent oxidoreductase, partial [Solirubrobacterales bacterium]|nr:LLM class flavin-dependent oxidoreductase [Solirubrobacterales bacterium]
MSEPSAPRGNPKLSVLDLAPVVEGASPVTALANSTELVRAAERLGYHRHWVAEHHNMTGIASSAPAVIIAHLAANSETIRVGSGGVMLPNHQPLVVAEQFGTLESLNPGRIDLGIGRAPGTDQVTAAALRRGLDPLSDEDLPRQLGELLGFFTGEWPSGHPYRQITAVPGEGAMPEIWLLGSSGYTAQVAGMLGMPYSFAHHFSAGNTEAAVQLYRSRFEPSAFLEEPKVMIGVGVICAETDEEARWLAGPSRLAFARLRSESKP